MNKEQVKSPDVEQPEKKTVDLIPEERMKELLNILLPYGYSYHDGRYTGVSPYIGDSTNIISIIANNPEGWRGVFVICMERFTEEEDEKNSLGFYKGIMKVIAPELVSNDNEFIGAANVIGFNWASDNVQDNRFPVKVEYLPK